jgi:2-amino-4-hydroxy-6-hydroxymethyldihydropteridine diphosphokinase
MKKVFLGLGGNLGDVKNTLQSAIDKIKRLPDTRVIQISPVYETSPVSSLKQNNFLNCVCSIETSLSPQELLAELQTIEDMLGKYPKPKDAPRPIDIDILLYEDVAVTTDTLCIPHPYLRQRLFVLAPLLDLEKSVFLPDRHEYFDVGQAVQRLMQQQKQHIVKLTEKRIT